MPIRPPTEDDLAELAAELYLKLTPEEREFFREQLLESLEDYETIRSYQPEPRLGGAEPRVQSSGTRPDDADNPYQMWVTRCEVRGDDGGELDGWDVAIKDNICVAGVEMTCGSHVVEGYVPTFDDATALDAGYALERARAA